MHTTTRAVDNSEDLIDSRDVIARIAELEGEREILSDQHHEAENDGERATASAALDEWDTGDAGAELKGLRALVDEAEGYCPDWRHGAALIRDSYFETYARDLAEDISGAELRAASWPFDHIDWEAAAEALKMDYTAVEFDGVTYWVR